MELAMMAVVADRDLPRWLGSKSLHIRCSMYLYPLSPPIQVDAGLVIWKGIVHDVPWTLTLLRRCWSPSVSIDAPLVHVGGRRLELA